MALYNFKKLFLLHLKEIVSVLLSRIRLIPAWPSCPIGRLSIYAEPIACCRVLQGEEEGAGAGGPLAQDAGPLHQECSQRGNQLR